MATPITKRQRAVVRTYVHEKLNDGGKRRTPKEKAMTKSLVKTIRKPGVSAKSTAIRQAAVKSARKNTTPAEARGVRQVLRRADTRKKPKGR